jgi:hypothetical protein
MGEKLPPLPASETESRKRGTEVEAGEGRSSSRESSDRLDWAPPFVETRKEVPSCNARLLLKMGRSRRDSNQEDYGGSVVIRKHLGNNVRMSASATSGQRSGIHRRCLCGGMQYPGDRQDDHNPVLSAEQRTSGKSQPDIAEHVEVYLFGYRKRLGGSCAMGSSGLQSLSIRKH